MNSFYLKLKTILLSIIIPFYPAIIFKLKNEDLVFKLLYNYWFFYEDDDRFNLSEENQFKLIKKHSFLCKHIKNPTINLQLYIVNKYRFDLHYFEKVDIEVQKYIVTYKCSLLYDLKNIERETIEHAIRFNFHALNFVHPNFIPDDLRSRINKILMMKAACE